MSLLVTIGFCGKDASRVEDLLLWCSQLGPQNHPCLLIADPDVDWRTAVRCVDLASKAFSSVDCVALERHVEGWTAGSVALFRRAGELAQERKTAWLWLEPDAVPVKPGWLDALESAYQRCGKQFMGPMVGHQTAGLPSPYLEGVAVYPWNACSLMGPTITDQQSWVFSCARAVVPNAINTPLIQHLFGEKDNPPTFAEVAIPGTAVHSLAYLYPDAVLFHRCKDGSLIRLLRKKHGIAELPAKEIAVLFSFCQKDAALMQSTIGWLTMMHGKLPRTAVLHYDRMVSLHHVNLITNFARNAFEQVVAHPYPTPQPPYTGWPAAPNAAFQGACNFMRGLGKPWLFFEGDAVAMKPDWLQGIENEYKLGGKPFMGTIVGGMGHMNGVAVYPPNVRDYTEKAFTCVKQAFDMAMAEELVNHRHKANHVIYHCRAQGPDGCCVDAHGKPPVFRSERDVNCIAKTICLFHPSKDGTLVHWLRTMKANHDRRPEALAV